MVYSGLSPPQAFFLQLEEISIRILVLCADLPRLTHPCKASGTSAELAKGIEQCESLALCAMPRDLHPRSFRHHMTVLAAAPSFPMETVVTPLNIVQCVSAACAFDRASMGALHEGSQPQALYVRNVCREQSLDENHVRAIVQCRFSRPRQAGLARPPVPQLRSTSLRPECVLRSYVVVAAKRQASCLCHSFTDRMLTASRTNRSCDRPVSRSSDAWQGRSHLHSLN